MAVLQHKAWKSKREQAPSRLLPRFFLRMAARCISGLICAFGATPSCHYPQTVLYYTHQTGKEKTYKDEEFVDIVQEAFTVVPAFGGGPRPYKVVCEGYSKAFKALCNRFDIPCVLVGCNDIAHLWNLVQMEDGAWYGVDVTWDDRKNGSPIYEYFLVGNNAMARKHPTHAILSSSDGFWLYDDEKQVAYGPMISEESYKPAK